MQHAVNPSTANEFYFNSFRQKHNIPPTKIRTKKYTSFPLLFLPHFLGFLFAPLNQFHPISFMEVFPFIVSNSFCVTGACLLLLSLSNAHASDSCIVRNNLKMHFIFVSMLVASSSPSCHSCRGEFDVILSLQQWGENERKGNVQGQCCLSVFRLPYWIMHNSTTGDFCNFSEQNVEHCNAWVYVMVFAWYFHSFMTHTQQNGRKIYVKRFSTQKLNGI